MKPLFGNKFPGLALLALAVESTARVLDFLVPFLGTRDFLCSLFRLSGPHFFKLSASGLRVFWGLRWRRLLKSTVAPPAWAHPSGAPEAMWLDLQASPQELELPLSPPPPLPVDTFNQGRTCPGVIVVYVHGGGFVCHTATEYPFAGEVLPRLKALGLPARTLALDYGLAPATSHATALTHCLHAWQKLAAQLRKEDLEDEKEAETGAAGGTPSVKGSTISSSNRSSFSSKDRSTIQGASVNRVGFGRGTKVVLCGDSAGGHLVIALTKQLRATAAAASDTANTFSPTPAAQKVDLAAVAEERAGGAGAEPVLLPAALVALSPWLQLTSPPQEKDGDTKPDILSPAMVNSFVADLVSGHRAEKVSLGLKGGRTESDDTVLGNLWPPSKAFDVFPAVLSSRGSESRNSSNWNSNESSTGTSSGSGTGSISENRPWKEDPSFAFSPPQLPVPPLPLWPPTLIAVGSSELIADDGRALATALQAHRDQSQQQQRQQQHEQSKQEQQQKPASRLDTDSSTSQRANNGGGGNIGVDSDDSYENTRAAAARAAAGAVDTEEVEDVQDVYLECSGGIHDWPLLPMFEPVAGDAQRGLDEIANFLAKSVRRSSMSDYPQQGKSTMPIASSRTLDSKTVVSGAGPGAAGAAGVAEKKGGEGEEGEEHKEEDDADWIAVEKDEDDGGEDEEEVAVVEIDGNDVDDEEEQEWLRRGKWLAFYEGTYAPHLAATALNHQQNDIQAAQGAAASTTQDVVPPAVALLPWRSKAPSSHLVAFVECLEQLQEHSLAGSDTSIVGSIGSSSSGSGTGSILRGIISGSSRSKGNRSNNSSSEDDDSDSVVAVCDGLTVPRAVLNRINLRSVLEAGCGTGENIVYLARRRNTSACSSLETAVVVGLDVSPVAVESAQRPSEQQADQSSFEKTDCDRKSSAAHAFAVANLVAKNPQEPLNIAAEAAAEALLAFSGGAGSPSSRSVDCQQGFDFLFDCQTFHCLYNIRGGNGGGPRHSGNHHPPKEQLASSNAPAAAAAAGGGGVTPRIAAQRYANLLKPGGHLLLLTGHAESDGGVERGPVRLTRAQVAHAFDGTTLRLVAGPSTTLFDNNDRYREQPFPTPPAAWISLWQKAE